jgi:hypothetical protein
MVKSVTPEPRLMNWKLRVNHPSGVPSEGRMRVVVFL